MTDEEKRIVEWLDREAKKWALWTGRPFAYEHAALAISRGDHMKGINDG